MRFTICTDGPSLTQNKDFVRILSLWYFIVKEKLKPIIISAKKVMFFPGFVC